VYANRIAPIWIKLPLEVKAAKNVNTFKNLLQQTEAIEKLRFDIDLIDLFKKSSLNTIE
jgi:hypothetical protein